MSASLAKSLGLAALVSVLGLLAGRHLSRSAPDPRYWHDFPVGAAIDRATLQPGDPWRFWQLEGSIRRLAEGGLADENGAAQPDDPVAATDGAPAARFAINAADALSPALAHAQPGAGSPGTARLWRRIKTLGSGERLHLRFSARRQPPGQLQLRLDNLAQGQPPQWQQSVALEEGWSTFQFQIDCSAASETAVLVLDYGAEPALFELRPPELSRVQPAAAPPSP